MRIPGWILPVLLAVVLIPGAVGHWRDHGLARAEVTWDPVPTWSNPPVDRMMDTRGLAPDDEPGLTRPDGESP